MGYVDETVDGSGINTQYTTDHPLINLNDLTIDSTSVTVSTVIKVEASGQVQLQSDSEVQFFSAVNRQLVNMKYVFGVYPIPITIIRLVTIMAGMKGVASKMSGSYSDFATVSLPGGVSGSKGQPYVNLQAGLRELEKEAKNIVEKTYRPFTQFG